MTEKCKHRLTELSDELKGIKEQAMAEKENYDGAKQELQRRLKVAQQATGGNFKGDKVRCATS